MACRVIRALFLVVYLVAVVLVLASTFRRFVPGPLSPPFPLILGVPWSLIPLGFAGDGVVLAVSIIAPAINLFILTWLCGRAPRPQPTR